MLRPTSHLLIAIAFTTSYINIHISRNNGYKWAAEAFTPLMQLKITKRHDNAHHTMVKSSINDEDEWRDFRARLVQNGLPSLENPKSNSDDRLDASSKKYAHITTPLVEVGSILVSIPTTDLCQALEQQYWHRAVVLITEVSDNLVSGNIEDMVPDEQLAIGANRGRWSYRGLLLNRCANMENFGSDDITTTTNKEEYNRDVWSIQRGGDLLGFESSSGTEFACLHSKSDASSLSTKLGGNLYYTPLSTAQDLCKQHPAKYHPHDFITFGGFCAWRPGQLELEMGDGREEWKVISVDGPSIWEELYQQQEKCSMIISQTSNDHDSGYGLLKAGTSMWKNFLRMIDVSEAKATERIPPGQLVFYDRMLQVWAEEHLTRSTRDNDDETSSDSVVNDSSDQIRPGTLVRARSPPTKDMLLYDAELIRSVILILEETSEATVGVILNHPMAAAIDCLDGENPLPLRYGGAVDTLSWRDGSYNDESDDDDDAGEEEVMIISTSDTADEVDEGFLDYQKNVGSFDGFLFNDGTSGDYGYDDDDDDDDSQFIWIHRNAKIGSEEGGGIKLGVSNMWLIKENDALEQVQYGSLRLEDVMIFSGVSIWEKGPDLGACGGGLKEQVDSIGALEIVQMDDKNSHAEMIENVWDILTKHQNVLTKESLENNIKIATKAWKLLSSSEAKKMHNLKDKDVSRERLSDATLKAWVARTLLEDPLNTLVEMSDDQGRDNGLTA